MPLTSKVETCCAERAIVELWPPPPGPARRSSGPTIFEWTPPEPSPPPIASAFEAQKFDRGMSTGAIRMIAG